MCDGKSEVEEVGKKRVQGLKRVAISQIASPAGMEKKTWQ